ncbi:putative efflux protein, MATE family [Acetomicrobium mobile DSM 13181]|uniref:Multidrug export protein MepA n=1 Tax=Acetomicrobium mobile (strain ATCC BAA-54 / DSM 13181 / JCM 12221 / NGA) TaxID=891968 RepID=I4BUD9_ACEMN|nr:MATE family efflux transporter [Acetomicrobium mobile]AFM20896.1 putative efflux protein, MATE family [Acetomicrobium mobile DSM 13181]
MTNIDNKTERLGREPVGKLLLYFSLPAIAGLFANALYNIVDRIFIGQNVGEIGLAAVTVAFPLFEVSIALCVLICVGAASIASRSLGAGKKKRAELVLGNALALSLIFVLFVCLGMLFLLNPALKFFGASEAVLGSARDYMLIVLLGMPFFMISFVLNSLIRVEGSPRWAMGTLIIGTIANIFLDWLFICAFGWGVKGAAWGTSIAEFLSCLWVALYYAKYSVLKISYKNLKIRMPLVANILAIGITPCITSISFAVLLVILNQTALKLGGDLAVSSVGIFLTLDTLFFLPALGISEAAQPIIGYNYGAGFYHRVRRAIMLALISCLCAFSLSWVATQFFGWQIVRIFCNDHKALIDMTVRALRIGYFFLPAAAIFVVTSYTLQSLGRAREALIIQLVRQLGICYPAMLIMPHIFGLDGIWMAFPATDLGGSILAFFAMYRELGKLKEENVVALKVASDRSSGCR